MQGPWASKYCALQTHGFITLNVLQNDGDGAEGLWKVLVEMLGYVSN